MDQPPRVLVVDDDPFMRSVTSRVLARSGYGVVAAEDGLRALELFLEGGFVAVVSDLHMPRMSGAELLSALRGKDPRIAFLLITGSAVVGSQSIVPPSPGVRMLPKPVELAVLRATLAELLQERSRMGT